ACSSRFILVVAACPAQQGIINKQPDSLPVTFIGNQLYCILLPVRIRDFPIRLFCIPVAETIVVPGNEGDILHARAFSSGNPFHGIETYRIKNRLEPAVFRNRNIAIVHHPFSVAQYAECTPVDKHAETGAVEPFSRCEILSGWLIAGLRLQADHQGNRKQETEQRLHWLVHFFRYITSFTIFTVLSTEGTAAAT